MLYIALIVFLTAIVLYWVGRLNSCTKALDNLENGSKVYCKRKNSMFPEDDNYYESSVIVDSEGNKYTDRFSKTPITKWDFLKGDVLTEDEYLYVFD